MEDKLMEAMNMVYEFRQKLTSGEYNDISNKLMELKGLEQKLDLELAPFNTQIGGLRLLVENNQKFIVKGNEKYLVNQNNEVDIDFSFRLKLYQSLV